MNFQPFGPRVLLKASSKEEKVGKLYLPEQAQEKPQTAKVVALGIAPNYTFMSKIGDMVVCPTFGGVEVKMDGEAFRVLLEEEILGRLENG